MRMSALKSCSTLRLLNLVVLCLLLVENIRGDDGSCNKGCPQSDNGIFKYTPGNVYEYTFDSVLTIALNAGGLSNVDDTSLKVAGSAKIYVEGNCGYTLQLEGLKISNAKESVEKKILSNIQKPVRFTMVSGSLVPQICTDAADSEYSLNIKRGIISLLQANKDADHEVDVFGECPTHTSISNVGNTEIISKIRDLNNCAYRENINSGLVSGVINDKAGIKSSMLLQAEFSKETKIENGLINNVQLVELYKFMGSVKGSTDINAKVTTTLKLKNQGGSQSNAPGTGSRMVSIIFQKPESYSLKNIGILKTTLNELIELTNGYIKKDSAKKFIELIRLLRNADTETLLDLGSFPHPKKEQARKIYLDALFRTNTAHSAKAILKQLNKFNEKEQILAILSLNLVETVDKETLTQAATNLTPNAPKEIYLAVGALVSKYCKTNECLPAVLQMILKKFTDSANHCKANTKKDEERIVYVLKGIGNAGYLTNNAATTLIECASPGRSNRIRVTALQAFLTAGCNSMLQNKALEILKDYNEDSELRIEAYLASITCPNAQIANEIAEILNTEKVNQVGGFIISNLKAIRDSTDPTREQQKYHLANIRLTKKFPRDFRRYSFNNEISYKMDALGLSASSDYKLIYSQHGFLPRSARINVTTEMFGSNFNVFEASVRQENLENVLEYYAGPKGLLNKDFDEIIKLIELGDNTKHQAKRSIADDVTKISKKYKTYGSKNIHDLNLDLSLKLFGSELAFLSLGDNIPGSLDDIIRQFSEAFDKAKIELSLFEKEFSSHNLFLDTEFAYPTGIGVPLEFSAVGLIANKIELAISVDVNAILEQNWQRAKYRLKLVPSMEVNIQAQLKFNAQVISTGLRVVSTAHSATGSDINVGLIKDGDGFNIDIDIPREKLELIEIGLDTEFFVALQDKQIKTIPLSAAKKANVESCYNTLEAIGIKFCVLNKAFVNEKKALTQIGELQQSFALYLLLEKKYNIKGTQDILPTGTKQWKLDFSTPGSSISHDTSLSLEVAMKRRTYGRISFINPHFNFGVEAGINNDDHELVIYAQYEENNSVKKSKIGFSKNGNEYRPVIEIQDEKGVTNNINGYRADGKVIFQQTGEKQARYNFEKFQISNEHNERVVVNGWADVGPSSLNTELHVSSGQKSYFVTNVFKLDNGEYAVGLFINDDLSPENIYGGSVQFITGDQNYLLKLIGKALSWSAESFTELQYVKVANSNNYQINSTNFIKDIKNKRFGSLKIKSASEVNKFQLEAEAVKDQETAKIVVNFERNQHSVQDYLLEANCDLNGVFVNLLSKCDLKGNILETDNSITTSWGTALNVKGELGQRYTAQDININLQGSVQINGKDKPSQWILKILGTPEKTSTEFRIIRDNNELMKLTGETQHPQDKISGGKVNLVVKNLLTAKSDFKLAKNGKGELTATIETQKTDPKHKIEIDSKFHVMAPKYEIETKLTLDGNSKIYFKTENSFEKQKLLTKNYIEANGKKITFEANGNIKGEWRTNGELQGNFALTAPDGRVIDGTLNRKVTVNAKTGVAQGNMEVQLNDQTTGASGGKKRSIIFSGKLDRFNLKSNELSVNSKIIYTDFDGQKSELNYHIKNLLNGENRALDVGVVARGGIISKPIDFSIIIDEYSAQHAIGKLSGKYGDKFSGNLNGNFKSNVNNGQELSTTFDLQGKVELPESDFKSFELKTHGTLSKSSIELFVDSTTANNQFARLKVLWTGTEREGNYQLEAETNNTKGPLKLDGSYHREHTGTLKEEDITGKQKYVFNLSHAEKYINTGADISYSADGTSALRYTLDTSFESAKGIELDIRSHAAPEDTYVISVQAKQSGKSYGLDTKLYRSTYKKGIDAHLTLQSGKPIVFVIIAEALGERKGKVTMDIQNLANMNLKINSETSYTDINDFYIIGKYTIKEKNYNLNVQAQDKAISIELKNEQSVIAAGKATYTLKNEKNKAIIEGQGQIQYQGKTHNGNFKVMRQIFDQGAAKEMGFAYTFNGNIGQKSNNFNIKITNKEFSTTWSICEAKKQCANIQLQSILSVDEKKSDIPKHIVIALVDLREFGYPYHLKLDFTTKKQGLNYEQNIDGLISSGENFNYQLIAKLVPMSSSFVKLILPKREILLECKQEVPLNGKLFGHYEHTVAFYIDKKNQPNNVIRISAIGDISGIERTAINANGQIKLEHPDIRPLSVSGQLEANAEQSFINTELQADIFRLPDQKVIIISQIRNSYNQNGFNITSTQQLRSSGLKIQYEAISHSALNINTLEFSTGTQLQGIDNTKASANIFINKEHADISMFALGEQIFQVIGDFNKQNNVAKINTKLQILDQKPVGIVIEMQSNAAKISVKQQNILDANAEVKLGKELKFDIIGNNKPLFNGRVALDSANFLQTTYKTNNQDVNNFVTFVNAEIKKETEVTSQKIKNQFEQIRRRIDQQVQLGKESVPDLTNMKTNYEKNAKIILQELQNDPALASTIEAIQNVYDKLTKIADEITKTAQTIFEKLYKTWTDLYGKLQVLWKDSLLQIWEDFAVAVNNLFAQIKIEIVDNYTKAFQEILSILEKYGPALKNYAKALNEAFKPLYEVGQELLIILVKSTETLLHELKEYVKRLPTFEAVRNEFNEKLNKLNLNEIILGWINNGFEKLHILPLTPEVNELLQKLLSYLTAKLKQAQVNENLVLEELEALTWKAVRSILPATTNSVTAFISTTSFGGLQNWFSSSLIPYSVDIITKLPALISIRFSFINFLLNENWSNIFKKDILKSWVFFQDFELRGHIVDGQHIFTFDGQHYAYPGNCKLILAQDSVDNNFTIIAQLNNAKLKAIILVDREGNYVEVSDTIALKVNGKAVEYPQNLPGIHIWRRFFTVHVLSEYGASIMCTTDLKICHIHINGFYTGKTRGLLGNGNAEPYDDNLLIDGSLATDTAALGNDYAIGKCTPVAFESTQIESLTRTDICSEIFGIESPLALSFLALDSSTYRKACDIAVQKATEKDKEPVACTFALAYGSALTYQNKLVLLPPRCLKCAGAVGQRDMGEEFTVKIPTNKADIVFVVDINVTPTVLSNLIAPTITDIRESLKSRGFTDVQIGVIVFDESKRYPALLTSDNGKINYKGNVANIQLNGPKNFCDNCAEPIIAEKRILEIFNYLEKLIKNIVPQSDEKAFKLAIDYPFRAGAAKSIIGVRSDSLEYNNWWKLLRAQITGAVTKFDGALLHLIAPVKGLSLEGVSSEKLIGFNSRLVATLDGKDNKKRNKLQFGNDMGIDFVLNNGGWVFATQNFDKLKPQDQKKMLNQVTSSIADTLFKTEIVSDCYCLPMYGLHGQHKCVIRSSSFVANKKPKAA